ncbi:MAG: hypothetical protein ABWY27_18745 [Telluria sp.]
MSEFLTQELLELSKVLQDSVTPNQAALVRLRQANGLVDSAIATLNSTIASEKNPPDAEVKQLEGAREAIFLAYAALCGKQGDKAELKLLIDATASLHDKVNTLCWLVGESQADRDEKLPGKFSSADDLFNALGV